MKLIDRLLFRIGLVRTERIGLALRQLETGTRKCAFAFELFGTRGIDVIRGGYLRELRGLAKHCDELIDKVRKAGLGDPPKGSAPKPTRRVRP